MSVLGEFLILRRVPPREAGLLGVEPDDHRTPVGQLSFKHERRVVVGNEAAAMRFKNWKESTLVLAIFLAVIDCEVSDEVDGRCVRHAVVLLRILGLSEFYPKILSGRQESLYPCRVPNFVALKSERTSEVLRVAPQRLIANPNIELWLAFAITAAPPLYE